MKIAATITDRAPNVSGMCSLPSHGGLTGDHRYPRVSPIGSARFGVSIAGERSSLSHVGAHRRLPDRSVLDWRIRDRRVRETPPDGARRHLADRFGRRCAARLTTELADAIRVTGTDSDQHTPQGTRDAVLHPLRRFDWRCHGDAIVVAVSSPRRGAAHRALARDRDGGQPY